MKNRIRKNSTFAAFTQRTILTFVCTAIFIASYTAEAAQYRVSISNGCCTSKSVIVLCGMERDTLSSFYNFNNLNFSFMQRTEKNASGANNSTSNARASYDNANLQSYIDDLTTLRTLKIRYSDMRLSIKNLGANNYLTDVLKNIKDGLDESASEICCLAAEDLKNTIYCGKEVNNE